MGCVEGRNNLLPCAFEPQRQYCRIRQHTDQEIRECVGADNGYRNEQEVKAQGHRSTALSYGRSEQFMLQALIADDFSLRGCL